MVASYVPSSPLLLQISYLFGGMNSRDSYSFPGCRKMESEIVRMCVSLFHGGSQSMGVVVPSSAEVGQHGSRAVNFVLRNGAKYSRKACRMSAECSNCSGRFPFGGLYISASSFSRWW